MKNFTTFILLMLIAIVGVFTLDVYLPATPAMAEDFGVKISDIALTFCWFSIVFAFSQLFYGKLSDRIGRKPVLIVGLVIAAIGTILCIYSRDYTCLIYARMLQAFGISVFVVVQAIVRDLYDGNSAVRARIFISTVSGITISIAPTIGGLLQDKFRWQGGFAASLFLIIITLIYAMIFYRESNQNKDKSKFYFQSFLTSYLVLITNKQYMMHVILATLAYTVHFVFIIMSSNIFINLLGFSPINFGYLMFIYGGIYFLSGLSTIISVKRFAIHTLINFSGVLIGLGGIIMLITVSLFPLNAWQILLCMTVMTIGITVVRAVATTGALTSLSTQAGQGSAGLNLFQFLLSAIIAAVVNQFFSYPQYALSVLAIVTACVIIIAPRIVVAELSLNTQHQRRSL